MKKIISALLILVVIFACCGTRIPKAEAMAWPATGFKQSSLFGGIQDINPVVAANWGETMSAGIAHPNSCRCGSMVLVEKKIFPKYCRETEL